MRNISAAATKTNNAGKEMEKEVISDLLPAAREREASKHSKIIVTKIKWDHVRCLLLAFKRASSRPQMKKLTIPEYDWRKATLNMFSINNR